MDFARLYLCTQACAFFVTRAQKNLPFYLRTTRPVDRSSAVRCDPSLRLTGIRTARRYPHLLRRITYHDAEKDLRLTFLTNNFSLLPLPIAQLYRVCGQVERFFRWIKQHRRIKAFYGTSENAVKTQGGVALAAYLLVAIAKKQLGLDMNLYPILEILSVTIFEKTPILEGFSTFNDQSLDVDPGIQSSLFDL